MANINRRQFIGRTSALGFAAGVGALSGMTASRAWAADTTGYKALVCIFLKGGMDHADTVIPYDQTSWQGLRDIREGMFNAYNVDAPGSSRNRNNLLQLNADNSGVLGGREFSLPPQLSALHGMFTDGDMAVVGNVGPLLTPGVTRAQMQADTANLPARLYSHNDQQSTWMALGVEGTQIGWGGKFADAIIQSAPSQNRTFISVSAGSNDPFLSGDVARQFRVSSSGAPEPSILSKKWYLGYNSADDDTRAKISEYLERGDFGAANYYLNDLAASNGRAITNSRDFLAARESATPLTTTFPGSSLGRQLRSVAETINIRDSLNISRQIFYVSTGGYDTHSNQANNIVNLHSDLAASMAAFRSALIEMGQWNAVTSFTMSDFGRTTIDNGDGTDHGWGAHHFVMGGAVNGRNVFGTLPSPDVDSQEYTPSRGRMIPSVSVEQYGATLGSWFGLTGSELNTAFPNLSNFNESDLGFMSGGVV